MNYVRLLIKGRKIEYKNRLLILWFNLEVYFVCAEGLLGGATTKSAILRYFLYGLLSVGIMFYNRLRINKKVICSLCGYFIIILINIMIVSWKKYAIVEAIPPIIVALPALFIVSSPDFDLQVCLAHWYPFCVFNSCLLVIMILLSFNTEKIGYGLISTITYSNTIILWFLYIKKIKKGSFCLILILFNNIAGIIFGSRMPALGAIITMIVSLFFLLPKSSCLKFIFTIPTIFSTIYLSIFYKEVVGLIKSMLNKTGIYSRSIERFYLEIQKGTGILGMLSDSGRRDIWISVLNSLKRDFIMPHGFGYVRYITEGKYYFSHNIFLDLVVIFGILGIFVLLIISLKLYNYKKKNSKIYWEFVWINLLFFLIRSITGAHFLGDKYSVLVLAMILFQRGIVYETTKY